MIVEVVPVWNEEGDEILHFDVVVHGAGRRLKARRVFVDGRRLEDPLDIELFEALRVRVWGGGEVADDVYIYTPRWEGGEE
jgi:hypothetical protein